MIKYLNKEMFAKNCTSRLLTFFMSYDIVKCMSINEEIRCLQNLCKNNIANLRENCSKTDKLKWLIYSSQQLSKNINFLLLNE